MFYVSSPHAKASPIFIKSKKHRGASAPKLATTAAASKVQQNNATSNALPRSSSQSSPNDDIRAPTSAWIMGTYYPTCHDTSFYSDYCSRIWCTYRRGLTSSKVRGTLFPGSSGTKTTFSSDAGWGCMLRSGQMMLAETLIRHTIGREWRLSTGGASLSTQHKPVLRMIVDHPNAGASPFSIQQLTSLGKEKYGKSPGDWYGPELFSQVVGDLMNGTSESPGIGQALGIKTVVARGSVVYRDVLRDALLGSRSRRWEGGEGGESRDRSENSKKSNSTTNTEQCRAREAVVSSLFLLVPVRLGLRELDKDYIPEILHHLELSSSVGIIGGRPGHSLYFVGSVQPMNSANDPQLVYLDPHFEQPACTLSETFPNINDLKTYHQPNPLAMPVDKVDPGLAFGFYCKSVAELDELLDSLQQFRSKSSGGGGGGSAPAFYVEDTLPASPCSNGKFDLRMNESWGSDDLQSVLRTETVMGSKTDETSDSDSPKKVLSSTSTDRTDNADDEWTFL
jgi:cysteine protease ATG4